MHERDGIYLRVNTDPYRQVYVFGDLHGCYDALQASLQANAFDPEQDLLISVGDLTDRGAQNIECLELLTQPWFLAVQGNHELMAINFLLHDKEEVNWYRNGGQWFWALREIEQERALELFTLANDLSLVIELNIAGKKIVIAHADYPDNHYAFGKAVDGFETVWNRQRYMRLRNGVDKGITGADEFYFGHTPDKEVINVGNIHFIDTGCVLGGALTMVKLK